MSKREGEWKLRQVDWTGLSREPLVEMPNERYEELGLLTNL